MTTTTDLVRADTNALVAIGGASEALDRLAQWVEAASNAHRLVVPLIDTYFIPDVYRPKVDPRATAEQKAEARNIAIGNATAAVLQGLSLGIDPLVSLQQIYIVHGRPGLYAKMMVALVQAHGHEVWDEDLSDSRAVVAGRRKGSEHIARVTITMDMARKAGWTKNEAYGKTPQDMLWSRAAARVCDRIASDVLKGIASVEEIQDELTPASNGGRTVTPPRAVAGRQRAEPRPLPAAPEPPLDDDPPLDEPAAAPPPPAPKPAGVTKAQGDKMFAVLGQLGITDRDDRLELLSRIVNRRLATAKDLTKDEAVGVIDTLENALAHDDPRAWLDALTDLPIDGEVIDEADEPTLDGEP